MVKEFVPERDVGFSFIDPNSIYFVELENLCSLHVCYEKWHASFACTFGEVEMSNPLDALGGFGAFLPMYEVMFQKIHIKLHFSSFEVRLMCHLLIAPS